MAGILTAAVASTFSGLTPDPYFEYTTLLLPGSGTNGAQNNTFLDGSTNNFTITRNGNTTQGTFSPFSQTGWGNYFDGSSYLTNTSAGLITSAVSTFTIQGWVYMTANPTSDANNISGFATVDGQAAGASNYLAFGPVSSRVLYLRWFDSGAKTAIGSTTLNLNRWYHIACVVNSNAIQFYVDGVAESMSGTTTLTNRGGTSGAFAIGKNLYGAISGYISNLSVTTTAVYTSGFEPSTSPLPTNTTGQILLTCQANRFIDSNTATTAKTLTTSGSPRVVAFSPFNPTASWSAATNGGSGYFDGSGDYLSVPDNAAFTMGSGDFTIEFWAYTTTTNNQTAIIQIDSGGSTSALSFGIQINTSKWRGILASGTTFYTCTASANAIANQWNHIAFVRNGNTGTLYINGTADGTVSLTGVTINDSSQVVAIGGEISGSSMITGYISNARIVKGTAVYTGNFTPPSLSPLTNAGSTSAASYPSTTNVNTSFASSATSLLLNFTNAGIYDATSKNDLETVGNAQISTAQYKFPPSSMAFDGTTDYLNISPERFLSFGTGSFTVEFWMKTSGSTFNIINPATATGTGYWALLVQTGSGGFRWNDAYNVTNLWTQTATSVLDNNWHHIAIVRNGTGSGNVKIYFDGVAQGTAKTDSTNYNGALTAWRVGSGNVGDFNGYLQDLRITPGIARYTVDFPAPTAAFPTL